MFAELQMPPAQFDGFRKHRVAKNATSLSEINRAASEQVTVSVDSVNLSRYSRYSGFTFCLDLSLVRRTRSRSRYES